MSARSGFVGKNLPGPFGAIWAHFSMDRKNAKNRQFLPIFLGWPMGPIQPLWANCEAEVNGFLAWPRSGASCFPSPGLLVLGIMCMDWLVDIGRRVRQLLYIFLVFLFGFFGF